MDLSSQIKRFRLLDKMSKNCNNYIYNIQQHPLTPELYNENLFNYGHNIAECDHNILDDWNCIKSLLPIDDTTKNAIDIGTKWGEWIRPMEPFFDLIYCFEPNLENINMISHNCNVSKLRLYKCCAGELYANSIYIDKKRKIVNNITLPIDFVNPKDIVLIRICANGNELQVIKGALKTILKYKPIIIVQYFEFKKGEALHFLFEIGMQLVTKLQNYYVFNWAIDESFVEYVEFNKELSESYEIDEIDNNDDVFTECLINEET